MNRSSRQIDSANQRKPPGSLWQIGFRRPGGWLGRSKSTLRNGDRQRNNFGGNESMKMLEKLILGLGQLVLSIRWFRKRMSLMCFDTCRQRSLSFCSIKHSSPMSSSHQAFVSKPVFWAAKAMIKCSREKDRKKDRLYKKGWKRETFLDFNLGFFMGFSPEFCAQNEVLIFSITGIQMLRNKATHLF